jgi:hypothetical protein
MKRTAHSNAPTSETILVFDADEVRRHVLHAQTCEENLPTYSQMLDPDLRIDGERPDPMTASQDDVDLTEVPPALHLVKDAGIYLMSNGTPMSPTFGDEPPYDVAYADGYGRNASYDAKVQAVGGDDFCQIVPIEWFVQRPSEDLFRIKAITEGRRLKEIGADVIEA